MEVDSACIHKYKVLNMPEPDQFSRYIYDSLPRLSLLSMYEPIRVGSFRSAQALSHVPTMHARYYYLQCTIDNVRNLQLSALPTNRAIYLRANAWVGGWLVECVFYLHVGHVYRNGMCPINSWQLL